jgi:outer membrane protein assembly factor BamB
MSTRRGWWLTFGIGLSALGCDAGRFGANPEMPLWMYRPSGSMHVVYQRNLVARSRIAGEPYERGEPEIDVTHRRVFVGSSDHGLYALRADDGSILWRFETLGFVQCAPLYDSRANSVYFGSNDGALYKVDADTGALVWRFMTNAEVARRPRLKAGVLYALNANDTVMALDARTGKLIWSQHRTPATGIEVAGYAGPLVWRDKVYAAFSDGTVTSFDARTGDERWPAVDLSAEAEQLLGDVPQYLDVDTTPVADVSEAGPVVYVGNYAGGVYALEADSGAEVWSNTNVRGVSDLLLWNQPAHAPSDLPAVDPESPSPESPLASAPAIPARKLLIASTGTTGLWALDPDTGSEVWRRQLPRGGVSAPAPILGALLVSASQLGLFLVSPLDGSVIDGIHMADGSANTPATFGRRAFVVTNGGSFLSLYVSPPIGARGPRGNRSPL